MYTGKKVCRAIFSPVHKETISLVEHKVVSVIRPVWNIVQEEPIATIYLDLDFDKLSNQWYRSAKMNQSFEFLILGEGQVLFDSQKGDASETETIEELIQKCKTLVQTEKKQGLLKLHGQESVISVTKHEDTGWYLVQYLPVWGLALQILGNMSVLLVVLAAVILITAAGSYALAKWVSRPVKELSDFMGSVAGVSLEGQEIALFPQEKSEGNKRGSGVMQMWGFQLLTYLGQHLWAMVLGLIVFIPFFQTHEGFGYMLPTGFVGGHGTAAAVGETFRSLGWEEAEALGMTSATVGILSGLIGGIILIKIATKKGYTNYITDFVKLPQSFRTGLIPEEEREEMGKETFSTISVDPLAIHVALLFVVAYVAKKNFRAGFAF